MRIHALLTAVLFISMSGILHAATAVPLATSFAGFQDWLPIILVGAGAAISLTVIYYIIGVILNNSRIKASALSEIQQAVGTVFLVAIILGVMFLIGSGTSLSYQGLLGSSNNQITNICTGLQSSQVSFLNSEAISQYDNLPYPTTAVCSIVSTNSGLNPVTANLDYGLAASYVVIANLTNQSVAELNQLYNFDSLIFFLRNLNTYAGICEPVTCAIPVVPRAEETTFSFSYYGGYVFHRTIMPTLTTQANLSIYLYMTQLIIIIFLLSTWPYLLAGGIILRTFSFTRRAGGLIVAAVIVGVIIYPTIFLFQYASLNTLNPTGFIGVTNSQIPALALCGVNKNTQVSPAQFQLFCYTSNAQLKISDVYKTVIPPPTLTQPITPTTINACAGGNPATEGWTTSDPTSVVPNCYVPKTLSFYSFPSIAGVVNLYSCYPPSQGGILELEASIVESLIITAPIKAILSISTVFSQLSGITAPSGPSPLTFTPGVGCGVAPNNIFSALMGIINIYGIMSVVAFILPIVNVLLMLSAIVGISTLIGGETNVLGLSRFL